MSPFVQVAHNQNTTFDFFNGAEKKKEKKPHTDGGNQITYSEQTKQVK